MREVRVDKWLAQAGLGSRKEVKALLRSGRVRLQTPCPDKMAHEAGDTAFQASRILTDPAEKIPEERLLDITVEGTPLLAPQPLYLMMNKAAGRVSTDEPGRPSVYTDLPAKWRTERHRLGAVGRLDRDTTGLLLFSSDGQLTHRLLAPRFHVSKRYYFRYAGPLFSERDIAAVAAGLRLLPSKGERAARGLGLDPPGPIQLRPARLIPGEEAQTAYLELEEGRYHQVRRMLGALGRQVLSLHRLRFGPLELDPELAPGACRPLTAEEIAALYAQTGLTASAQRELL